MLIPNEMFQKTESITPHTKMNARNLKEEIISKKKSKGEKFRVQFQAHNEILSTLIYKPLHNYTYIIT